MHVFFFFPNDAYWIGEGGGMWLYISRQNNARNGNGGQCMHGLLTKKQLLLAKVQLIPCQLSPMSIHSSPSRAQS